jgi:Ca-activated chloride channel family protein
METVPESTEPKGWIRMSLRLRNVLTCFAVLILAPVSSAWSQGFVIDRRPQVPISRAFEIREVTVDARIRDQVAEVQVSQTFHNPGSFELETEYIFPLPEEGAIQNFVLMVDGRELPGRLMPKEEARRIYEEIVRTKRDPALLEYMGRGLIRTSVFPIPPGADRKVTMRYTLLCRRDHDIVEFSYPFGTQKFTAKPIQRLILTANIDSKDAIKSIYSPSHDCEIRRSGEHSASIRLEQRDVIPATDFRVVYTLAEGALGATVLSYRPSGSEDGYFMLLASPKVKPADEKPRPKSVIFVLDRSGSMSGKKIEQARNALKFVLENLRDDDLFNIIAYDDRVETYKPELQRYSREARESAVRFAENIQPGGSTNIDGALKSAFGMLQDDSRPNYVIFLTDGLPTAGETRETAIAENARSANRLHSRVFVFGVGYDVNARLLDRLSGGNAGTSEYVKPDDNIEAYVSRFFSKMTSPVLANLSIDVTGTDVNRTYPRDVPDLFEGGQLVWIGRYRQSGRATIRVSGKVGQDRQEFSFPTEFAEPGRGSYDFVERLWAMRRIGFIIDQIDLNGKSRELTDELLALSTRYGILTPYTSFLADERVPLYTRLEHRDRLNESLGQLREVQGAIGVGQRDNKSFYNAADKPADSFAANGVFRDGSVEFRRGQVDGSQSHTTTTAPQQQVRRLGRGAGMMGGGMGGMSGNLAARSAGGGFAPRAPSGQPGVPAVAQDAEGYSEIVDSVRHIGGKTFYRKANRWVDSSVKPDEESKAIEIEQFSDAFFRLAETQKSELNQYLTFQEPVTVKLDGKVYRIEQAKK